MGSGGTGLGIGGAAEAGTTAGTGALAAITGGLAAAVLEVGAGFAGGVIIVLVGVIAAGGGVLFEATVFGGPDVLRFGGTIVAAAGSPVDRGRAAGGVAAGASCLFAGAAAGAAFADGKFDPAGAAVAGAPGFAFGSGFFTAPESVSVTSMETTWSRRTIA